MWRVLGSFKLNAYEVLDVPMTGATADPDAVNALVKKAFRQKSLLLHPDKLKHERGSEAFDLIKKVRCATFWVAIQADFALFALG